MTKKPDGPRFRRYSSETRGAMLIEAALVCLARGGITAFTVDNICREAKASRGLITHHFGSKDALLAAVYATMYDRFTAVFDEGDRLPGAVGLIEANFDPAVFNPESLKIWLALWGEIANNEDLRAVHRQRYQDLLDQVARTLAEEAAARGKTIDARSVAVQFVALSDGVWVENGIDPTMLSREAARESCYAFLENLLGALARPAAASIAEIGGPGPSSD
ncbi:MAG: TetR family transcriptional regulator [Rhodobacteraceae bacterium]|nr:TetR family transcriptional regulator [Paracoccaceae bacterium]